MAISIMGKSTITPEQCEEFLRMQNPNAPYLADIYIKYCDIYGIRLECIWVQMCLETYWLKYSDTSITTLNINNFAGLGAIDGNGRKQALSFNTVEDGVKCHVQHLYAYCTNKELPKGENLIDPRFKYVVPRGSAPNLEDLGNGKWASDKEYASKLINLLNQLLNTKQEGGNNTMVITYDYGHGTGQDRGADGYLNEEKVIREYGSIVVSKLKALGHTLCDCTPSATSNLSLAQSLAYRVNKANSYNSQLHLCFHANAFETDKAEGCEVEYISNAGKVYADKICTEISNSLGYKNRGSQLRTGLYVLKYTNMPAILLEPFFCDTKSDCDKYNAEKLATAIVKGITGIDTSVQTNTVTTVVEQVAPKYEETIPTGTNIFPILNSFYIEKRIDGDMAIHLDRGNYIVIRKGGSPEVYWNNNQGQGGVKRLF